MLNTAQKIALATLASRAVLLFRKMLGRPPEAEFTRRAIRWRLDLREGIDFSIYLLGAFEPETVKAYSAIVKPGQTVLDIGANIGAHTLPLAGLVGEAGKVFAFEPTAFAVRKCAANMALNADLAARISLHQIMLVEKKGESLPAGVFSSWPLIEAEALHEKHRGRLMDTKGARTATLDEMVAELKIDRIDFIKLDVDGYEYPVLAGARATLARYRPVIAMELAPYVHAEHGHSLEELVSLLTASGYDLRHIDSHKPLSADAAILRKLIPEGGSINVLAIPGGSA